MTEISARDFGALEARVDALADQITAMREEMRERDEAMRAELREARRSNDDLRQLLAQAKGGWWVIAGLFATAATLGGLALAVWRAVKG